MRVGINKGAEAIKPQLYTAVFLLLPAFTQAAPVPGYVPPVTLERTHEYADDTRGVYVPPHDQYRLQREEELQSWSTSHPAYKAPYNPQAVDARERSLNILSNGAVNLNNELNRISQDPGLLQGGSAPAGTPLAGDPYLYGNNSTAPAPLNSAPQPRLLTQQVPPQQPNYPDYGDYPAAVAPGQVSGGRQPAPNKMAPAPILQGDDGGVEIAVTRRSMGPALDMHNSLVRLREDRITVRRVLQRMMDQIGGGSWTIVWDLDEQNAGLPEMEISIYAEEPFMNVMNALLARVQTRSGQPLRAIRYDQTQRLVITDRTGGYRLQGHSQSVGLQTPGNAVVTERMLKDTMVSLHYDEIPLVDALENIVDQAGKGQWRLRLYAGMDQMLKPAHVEEPFSIAMERLLKLFNLKYEIFPGGKLVVVTQANRFGYGGIQQ